MQEEVGLQSATDGEFRRATWHMDFIYALGGVSKAPGHLAVKFTNPSGTIEWTPAALHVGSKVRLDHTIFGEDFTFVKDHVTTAVPKQTIPSPNMVHYRGGPAMLDPEVYPDIEGFWADLAAAYADEVRRLGELGCTYLQFDDTSLAYLNDPAQRAQISGRGEDAEHMHLRYIKPDQYGGEGQAGRHGHHHPHVPGQLPLLLGRLRRLRLRGRGPVLRAERGRVLPGVRRRALRRLRAAAVRAQRARWWCSAWSPPSGRSWSPRTTSSAASTKRPSTCRWTRSACPASAGSPPRWRATR